MADDKLNSIEFAFATNPEIRFENRIFCFTGDAAISRKKLEETVISRGGQCKNYISQKTDYLVVGRNGNTLWAFDSYGKKIELAIEFQKAGAKIQIIGEDDFLDAASITVDSTVKTEEHVSTRTASTPSPEREAKGESLFLAVKDFTAIDIETTGFSPATDSIIELAAVRFRSGEKAAEYSQLVNPGGQISKSITKLTGITNDDLTDMPTIKDALPAFLDFVGEDIIVGHNVNFDINFIYDNCVASGIKPLSNDFIDTMKIARTLYPDWEKYKLDNLIGNLNLDKRDEHRACNDAVLTGEAYLIMCAEDKAGECWLSCEYGEELSAYLRIRPDLLNVIDQNWIDPSKLIFERNKSYSSIKYGMNVVARVSMKKAPYISLPRPDSNDRFKKISLSDIDEISNFTNDLCQSLQHIIDTYTTDFSCCSRYMECSDAIACTNPDKEAATRCSYRKKLKNGIVFYGENRNIE